MQNEIPLFPNDPAAQKKWFAYFSKPDLGAPDGLNMTIFRKKLEEQFMSDGGNSPDSQWMGPSEILEKVQKITDVREEAGLVNIDQKRNSKSIAGLPPLPIALNKSECNEAGIAIIGELATDLRTLLDAKYINNTLENLKRFI